MSSEFPNDKDPRPDAEESLDDQPSSPDSEHYSGVDEPAGSDVGQVDEDDNDEQTVFEAEQFTAENDSSFTGPKLSSDDDELLATATEQSLSAAERSLSAASAILSEAERARSEEEQALREEVEQSEQELDGLERELAAVDAALEALSQESHKYELLSRIKRSLEELDNLDANELFWDEHSAAEDRSGRLAFAQKNIDSFGERIAETQEQREAIVERIGNKNNVLDVLHYDLRDTIEREEARRDEWLVERDVDELPYREQVMPWAKGVEEDRRLRKSLGSSVTASLLFALLISLIAIPIMEDAEKPKLPERMAKLVSKKRTPPPEPVIVQEIPTPQEPPEPAKELVEELVPDATQQQVVAEQPVQPDTREQVKSKGILAFRENFAAAADTRPAAQLGAQARFNSAGENSVGRPERMMVTTSAPGSSGGINLSDISRDTGGGGGDMTGVAVTQVSSSIGGGEGPDRPLAAGASAGRTDEEIQIVFDRYKAALYRLYNRALRNDPTLRGQMVLRLTIESDGSVSFIELQSSDMGAPALSDQIVDRVRSFDFGAKEDIVAVTIIYPIDFLPAS